jgi:ribosome-associated protein
MQNQHLLLNKIAQVIFDKKGFNILALDLSNISAVTDYVVIAEGNVERHVIAIAYAIEKTLEECEIRPIHVEGMQVGDWVVLDYLNMMVHLFMPGMRDRYQLEELWRRGEIVDLQIETTEKQLF